MLPTARRTPVAITARIRRSLTGQRGAIDVGLLREAVPRRGLQLETLLDEPVHAVRLAAHPLATRVALDLDLADEPFVLWRRSGSPGLLRPAHRRPPGRRILPPNRLGMRGIRARQGLIAAGLGVSLDAASYTDFRGHDVRFVPLTGPPVTARVQLAWCDMRPGPRRDLLMHVARELTNPTGGLGSRRAECRVAWPSPALIPARATDASTIIAGRNTRAPRPFLETPPSLSGASCPRSRSPSPSRY